ncbi:MAG: TetR/AcrR family transcriptional regulator [Candidatus Hydrogenedentes bacterium]|nr:TetR/AcrR family transcriptional regulator [Candidatus Hydrogenedentota bacterium]
MVNQDGDHSVMTQKSSSGKQREIQMRDDLFLRVARDILLEDGYHGLTMARIASVTRFSKGTLYNRFTCKEDLVVELACRCREERIAMVDRAMRYEGRPRERMVAIGEAAEHFARLYPESIRVLHIIDAEAVLEKVPEKQRSRLKTYDERVFAAMADLIEEAISLKDLALPPRTTVREICFALWALVDGGASARLGGLPLEALGIADSFGAIARGCHYLMDGLGWRPLTTEINYSLVSRQIRDTLLSEEAKRVTEMQSFQTVLARP